jgi:hypothetical protein
VQRLLHGVHDLRLDGLDIGGEVPEEIILGNPAEALRIDIDVRHPGGRRPLREQRADRLTLVEPERRDVDEADDVRCVGAERGDDLASEEWPVRTVGPLWRVSTWRTLATSSASELSGS